MMHLTAISIAPRYALVSQHALVSSLVCVAPERHHLCRGRVAHGLPAWSESVFRRRAVNSLEMPNAGFHYSVIGGNVPTLLACGEIDRRLLNDEASASDPRLLVPMLTQCGYCPCSCTAGDERRFNPDCAGRVFEPVEERLMQTTVILFREYKSTSRSRISE